jgi:F0F1-type ATP synthase assembly protein I
MDEIERTQRAGGEVEEAASAFHTGTTGADARDRTHALEGGGPADQNGVPTPHGSREEVLERVMEEQAEIEAAQGATPEADPSQRLGFTRSLLGWTLAGAFMGAALGAFAGWLAYNFKDSAPPIIIALAAVGALVGAVIVGFYRVSTEDGRVERAVEAEVRARGSQGTPGDEEPGERRTEPAGTRSGG